MWRESEEERDCERRAAGWALVDIVELPTRRESRVNYTRGRGLWQCLRLSLSLSLSLSRVRFTYVWDTTHAVSCQRKRKGHSRTKGCSLFSFFTLFPSPSRCTFHLSLSLSLFLSLSVSVARCTPFFPPGSLYHSSFLSCGLVLSRVLARSLLVAEGE